MISPSVDSADPMVISDYVEDIESVVEYCDEENEHPFCCEQETRSFREISTEDTESKHPSVEECEVVMKMNHYSESSVDDEEDFQQMKRGFQTLHSNKHAQYKSGITLGKVIVGIMVVAFCFALPSYRAYQNYLAEAENNEKTVIKLREEIADYQSKLSDSKALNKDLTTEIEMVKSEKEKHSEEIERLKAENQQQSIDIEALNLEKQKLSDEIDQMKADMENLKNEEKTPEAEEKRIIAPETQEKAESDKKQEENVSSETDKKDIESDIQNKDETSVQDVEENKKEDLVQRDITQGKTSLV